MFSYPVSTPEFNYQTALRVQFPRFPPLFATTEIEISSWFLLTVLALLTHPPLLPIRLLVSPPLPTVKEAAVWRSFNCQKPDFWYIEVHSLLSIKLMEKRSLPKRRFAGFTCTENMRLLQTSASMVPPARKFKTAPNKGPPGTKTSSSYHDLPSLHLPGKGSFQ